MTLLELFKRLLFEVGGFAFENVADDTAQGMMDAMFGDNQPSVAELEAVLAAVDENADAPVAQEFSRLLASNPGFQAFIESDDDGLSKRQKQREEFDDWFKRRTGIDLPALQQSGSTSLRPYLAHTDDLFEQARKGFDDSGRTDVGPYLDQYFDSVGAEEPITRGAFDASEQLPFGFGDKGVARSHQHVHRFDRLGAERQGADRLDAAQHIDLMRAPQMHGRDDGRVGLTLIGRGRRGNARHTGD